MKAFLMVVAWLLACGVAFSQEEPAVPSADVAEAAAAPGTIRTTPQTPETFRLGGLRKRIFSDRDAQRYRIDEESVFDALEASKESGDITDDMSLVERARVIAMHLQTKPENAAAYSAMTKAKTPEERRAAVRELMTRVKAIIRILELLESSLPGL